MITYLLVFDGASASKQGIGITERSQPSRTLRKKIGRVRQFELAQYTGTNAMASRSLRRPTPSSRSRLSNPPCGDRSDTITASWNECIKEDSTAVGAKTTLNTHVWRHVDLLILHHWYSWHISSTSSQALTAASVSFTETQVRDTISRYRFFCAGLGLVQALASRDNIVVFAGARNPDAAEDLQALEAQHPGKVHTVKLVANDEQGNRDAVEYVKKKAGRLDVVIANAGKCYRPLPD
jgi:hypothetical protein